MADPTTNFGWDIPQDGETNWGDVLNATINDIDADVFPHLAKLETTDSSTDINSAGTIFPWDSAPILDSGAFTFDGTNHVLTVDKAGIYEIQSNIAHYSDTTNARENPGSHITINGVKVPGFGRSGYTRNANGHDDASTHAHALEDLASGDNIRVEMEVNGNTGVSTPVPAGCVMIVKRIR